MTNITNKLKHFKSKSSVDPQPEKGYRRIENNLLKTLYKIGLNGSELSVFLCLLDISWGWDDKYRPTSYTQLSELTNINIRTVRRVFKQLENRNMIVTEPYPNSRNLIVFSIVKYN